MRAWLRRGRVWLRRGRYRVSRRPDRDVRLHLGCGADYWPGFVNVDADPAANSDVCMEFSRLGTAFRDRSVSEVAMIHSLSYLRLWQARDLFRDLVRLMQPGGRLVIELPDMAKCARRVLDSEGDPDAYLEALRAIYAWDVEWIPDRVPYTPYAFGWSAWHLKAELERAGFRDVAVGEPQTHGQRLWRDTRVEAVK